MLIHDSGQESVMKNADFLKLAKQQIDSGGQMTSIDIIVLSIEQKTA